MSYLMIDPDTFYVEENYKQRCKKIDMSKTSGFSGLPAIQFENQEQKWGGLSQ